MERSKFTSFEGFAVELQNFDVNVVVTCVTLLPVCFKNNVIKVQGEGRAVATSIIIDAFMTSPESPNWNPDADLNKDGSVDMCDVSMSIEEWSLPTEFSFKNCPIIMTIDVIDANTSSVNQTLTDEEIRSDVSILKDMGFTAILFADEKCGNGIYDDDPTRYRSYSAFQICQELGLYCVCSGNNVDESNTTEMAKFGVHLEALANCFRRFPNLIAFYFDDIRKPTMSLDGFVRQHFNLGHEYAVLYSNTAYGWDKNITEMIGQPLVGMLNYLYSYSPHPHGIDGFSGTDWVYDVDFKCSTYASKNSPIPYAEGIWFDAWEQQVTPDMWEPQADVAMQSGMLVYAWFVFSAPPSMPGFKTHQEW